jgi:hypothetical protein
LWQLSAAVAAANPGLQTNYKLRSVRMQVDYRWMTFIAIAPTFRQRNVRELILTGPRLSTGRHSNARSILASIGARPMFLATISKRIAGFQDHAS